MNNYKGEFIEFMALSGVLTFGEFKTKSGRLSPYFVNTGNYRTGLQISKLGEYYASCYMDVVGKPVSALYGPAYKGIPLAVTTAAALFQKHNLDIPFCFNRKEAKDHGEGGTMIGHQPKAGDNMVIIEDVITAGTALRETMDILGQVASDITVEALIIQVDRMERATGELSAVQQAKLDFGIPVHSIVTVQDILSHLYNREVAGKVLVDDAMKAKIEAYLKEYGV
ncbi:MAG: orotate phosphoribosyltransferase [Defluviitaleaceae bacterium]|nr:orotate phosphoribosyltransferase [Defluviitaleaceae bacterium]